MKLIALAGLAVFAAGLASAQEETGPQALLGTWEAPCDAWGTPADCRLGWTPGLTDNQLDIRYDIVSRADGEVIFSGKGVYQAATDGLRGYWADSGGAVHPLSAAWNSDTLTTHWGTAGGAQGRSRYHLASPDRLVVTDWALTEEGWQQFMQVEYGRAG